MLDFTLLVLDGAYASSVAVTVDVLGAAASLAPRLGVAPPTWRLVSPDGGACRLGGGLSVATARLPLRPRDDRSTWVVPGLGLEDAAAVDRRLARDDAQAAARALARHTARGGRVAASCSAVFLLHAAGVLDGRRATTSWWLAPLLARRGGGAVDVDADRMVCTDGPVVTAGAAFAQTDLMLNLLRDRSGPALADAVSRVLLVDARQAQAPFVVPEVMAAGDALVGRVAARIEAALPDVPSVAALAQAFCMSERTLTRHVRRVTGRGTLDLVQSVRLRRARSLLATSRLTVDQVAAAVGYEDATALRRLMRRLTGATPSHHRPAPAR